MVSSVQRAYKGVLFPLGIQRAYTQLRMPLILAGETRYSIKPQMKIQRNGYPRLASVINLYQTIFLIVVFCWTSSSLLDSFLVCLRKSICHLAPQDSIIRVFWYSLKINLSLLFRIHFHETRLMSLSPLVELRARHQPRSRCFISKFTFVSACTEISWYILNI